MTRHLWLLAFALIAPGALLADASAQVLYSDSFDRTEGSGDPNGKPADPNNFSAWGDNDNALGGTLVNSWVVGPSRGGGANQVADGNLASTIEGGAHYAVDVSTLAPLGFTVEFDFNRFHPFNPGSGNGFLAVGLGADTGSTVGGGGFVPNNSDLAIIFQQGVGGNVGNTQILQDNSFAGGTNIDGEGPLDYGDPTAWHRVQLTLRPAVPGMYGDADTILGTLTVDSSATHSFSVLGGSEFGNLAFSSNGFVHRAYDNLVVSVVPEPMGVLLAGLGLVAAAMHRRPRVG